MSDIELKNVSFLDKKGENIDTFDIKINKNQILLMYSVDSSFDIFNEMLLLNTKCNNFEYYYFGENLLTYNMFEIDEWKYKDTFKIDSNNIYFDDLSIIENIKLSIYLSNIKVSDEIIYKIADELSIGDILNKKVNELNNYQIIVSKLLLCYIINPFIVVVNDLKDVLSKKEFALFIELIVKNNNFYNTCYIISISNIDYLQYSDTSYTLENKKVLQ